MNFSWSTDVADKTILEYLFHDYLDEKMEEEGKYSMTEIVMNKIWYLYLSIIMKVKQWRAAECLEGLSLISLSYFLSYMSLVH